MVSKSIFSYRMLYWVNTNWIISKLQTEISTKYSSIYLLSSRGDEKNLKKFEWLLSYFGILLVGVNSNFLTFLSLFLSFLPISYFNFWREDAKYNPGHRESTLALFKSVVVPLSSRLLKKIWSCTYFYFYFYLFISAGTKHTKVLPSNISR